MGWTLLLIYSGDSMYNFYVCLGDDGIYDRTAVEGGSITEYI